MNGLLDRLEAFLRPQSHGYAFLLLTALLSCGVCYTAGHGSLVDFLGHLAIMWSALGVLLRVTDRIDGR